MLKGLLQAGAFVTAVASLATLPNALHRYLELFSHFRLQYFAISLALALIFLLWRERRWGAGMALLAVINFLPLQPWYLAPADRTAAGSPELTLMLANVLASNTDTDALLALIRAERPDLIFLQEVTPAWAAAMAPLQPDYPHRLERPQDDNFGIAVYARKPFLRSAILESPPLGLPTIKASQAFGKREITFVTTHPVPPMGIELATARNTQLLSVAQLLHTIAEPKVLIGDLNITMWAHHYTLLAEGTGMRNSRFGFGVLPSWPTHLPFAAIPIDHCLISDDLAVVDMRTASSGGSDHKAIIVTLAYRDEA